MRPRHLCLGCRARSTARSATSWLRFNEAEASLPRMPKPTGVLTIDRTLKLQ